MIPLINKELCTGCENCLDVCPPRAILMKNEKAEIEDEFCEECGFCAADCPVNAIKIAFLFYADTRTLNSKNFNISLFLPRFIKTLLLRK